MVVDILRRIKQFAKGTPQQPVEWGEVPEGVGVAFEEPVSPNYEETLALIRMVSEELSRIKFKLLDELAGLRRELQHAAKTGRRAEAELIAADYVLKRKVLHGVTVLEKMFNVVARRIETAQQMDTVRKLAGGIYPVIDQLTSYIATISPEFAGKMISTREALERLYRNTGIMAGTMDFNFSPAEIDPEVKQLLQETFKEASSEVNQLAPNPPKVIDYEDLEEKLVEYIKAHNGIIKLSKAAKDLGVSKEVVKEALYRLAKKGVISLSKQRSGHGQAAPA